MQALGLEERKKALEKKFVEKRPPLAYAKISGRVLDNTPFEKLITHLPAELGRGPISSLPDHRIALGEQKAISRLHARIQWNQSESCFELQCLGKNGMFADGKFVTKNQTVKLSSKMPLKIGHARVYFLCAIRSTISTMSGFKIIQKAFEKAKYHKGVTTMTANQVCDQILESFPKSEHELGGKDHLRTFVTSYLQEDTVAFERVEGGSPVPVYKMKPVVVADSKKSASTNSTAKPEETGEAALKKQKVTA
ncbi:Fork head transcription factor Fhl1 [Phytophthora palmivora]|uniref:Fork head transcription factor Fhl1 n=1 Tax=Phytophthora palmivora TaxID=4796 RepID=A0A2P4XYN2_9STRA|nr:Fork head transcription factor Fhl1 [Phytophthora palmivora]